MIDSPDTKREDRIPPGQTQKESLPALHVGDVPDIDIATWLIRITGLVKEDLWLSYDELQDLPQVTVYSDVHCVTTWSHLDNEWQGVSTREIAEIAQVDPGAKYVIISGVGDYSANLSLDYFLAEDSIFALAHDGEVLSPAHGFPVRLVIPRLYFWKSVKWVTKVEFSATDRPGYWERRGYNNRGDPWQEERFAK